MWKRKWFILAALIVLASPALAGGAVVFDDVCDNAYQETGARWIQQEKGTDGTILSTTQVCWFVDLQGIGCWDDLDECGAEVRQSCRRQGCTGVKKFSMERSPDVNGVQQDTCSGTCADDDNAGCFHTHYFAFCTDKKPDPKPPDPVTDR